MLSRKSKWNLGRGLILSAMASALLGCTPERDPNTLFAPEGIGILVIDAVLIVDQPQPLIKLSRTLAPDVPFTQENAAETGADIYIRNAATGASELYEDVLGFPGFYQAAGTGFTVEPETEYELFLRSTEDEVLSARTTTPARFQVQEWVLLDSSGTTEIRQLQTFAEAGDSVYFQPENQLVYAEGLLEARFAAGGAGQFFADGYQVALFSIDPDSDYVIDPPFFEEEDFEDLAREGSSPVLSALDGRVRLPWFGIFFEGRYNINVYTLDLNWYDLVRTTPLSGGGLGFGGNAGDGVEPPTFHVEGGIGLFGSASVDSLGIFILPQ